MLTIVACGPANLVRKRSVPPLIRADLQGAFRAPGSENLAKGRQLIRHLFGAEKVISEDKIHHPRYAISRSYKQIANPAASGVPTIHALP